MLVKDTKIFSIDSYCDKLKWNEHLEKVKEKYGFPSHLCLSVGEKMNSL